ncbi:MAG TPA: hypothetical protein VF590_11050 [Isosphaeraceae bacterium]
MMELRLMRRGLVASALLVVPAGTGCAHRRPAFYPSDYGGTAESRPEVRVRAPFVDVRVPATSAATRTGRER